MIATEKEIRSYYLNYLHQKTNNTVEVHEIDMGGWILYECFVMPDYAVIHISNENNLLQCLELEQSDCEEHAVKIMRLIGNSLKERNGRS